MEACGISKAIIEELAIPDRFRRLCQLYEALLAFIINSWVSFTRYLASGNFKLILGTSGNTTKF